MTESPVLTIGDVLSRCRRELGPCELVADRSMPHGEALTLEVETAAGVRWIAKHVRREKKYRQELTAYLEWVPALGPGAPTLHSAHDDLHLLLVSRLPGRPADGTPAAHDPEVHRRAGALTRLLHGSAAPVSDPGFAADLLRRLEKYIARAGGLLSADEIGFARARVAALDGSPVVIVPCHRDNQPRNWIVGERGELGLIDFGHAERHNWITDVGQLRFRFWRARPELGEAFFDGYGREPGEADWRLFHSYVAYLGLSTVVWAHEHDDPEFEVEGHDWLRDLMAELG